MTPQQAEAPEADLIAELREVLWITTMDLARKPSPSGPGGVRGTAGRLDLRSRQE